jgi:hypothetical protein
MAWLAKSEGRYNVVLSIDESNIYLAPRPKWKAWFGEPEYTIPRGDILDLELEAVAEIIRCEGLSIRCEDFAGEVFEEPLGDLDVKQLIDTDVLTSMMERRPVMGALALGAGINRIRVGGLTVIMVAATCAYAEGRSLVALGIITAGTLVVGVLGSVLSRALTSDVAAERVAECTIRELTCAMVVCVVPPSITGGVICIGGYESGFFPLLVASVSLALAFSMAILLGGLVSLKIASK